MKRIFSLLLATVLCLCLVLPAAAASPVELIFDLTANGSTLKAGLNEVSAKTGDIITVTYTVRRTDSNASYSLNSIQNEIKFDESFFQFVSVTPASGKGDLVDKIAGTRIYLNDVNTTYNANQVAGTFQLKVIGRSGSGLIECTEQKAYDANGETITVTAQNLLVTIADSPGGGGGPTQPATYDVTINAAANGSVESSLKKAAAGETVTLTVKPNEGYKLETITVKDKNGREISLAKVSATTYTFTMPASAVTVNATFIKSTHSGYMDCPRDNTCPIDPFTDTANDFWWHDGIHYCIEMGIMKGVAANTFDPNGNITRAMIVVMIYRLEGSPITSGSATFVDVPANEWFTDAVIWAAENGIVKGISDTEFAPNVSITREQLATLMYRYAQFKGIDTETTVEDIRTFDDSAAISDWAAAAMRWTISTGLIKGMTDRTLEPLGTATRAQASTIFMRLCENVLK